MIILSTAKNESLYKAIKCEAQKYDDVSFLDSMGSRGNYRQQIRNYTNSSKNLNELSKTVSAKRGRQWVKDYLKNLVDSWRDDN